MKILVTGAKGFIGKNLIIQLKNLNYTDIFEYDRDTDLSILEQYCKEADFVYHLAGVNRSELQSDFMEGNFGFTSTLLDMLKKHNNTCPLLISSSIQATLNNPYGMSKKAVEDLIFQYSKDMGVKVFVYRLPNVFGKWCRPGYNSVVATFCHNIASNLPIIMNDPNVVLNLVYIDDVIAEFIKVLHSEEYRNGPFCEITTAYTITLGEIVKLIYSFKNSRNELTVPNMHDEFTKKLYSTYLSYLPEDDFSYNLKMNIDNRGSFTEFIKSLDQGQISINISKPGVTKGNHWHHTKNEKFLVVSGRGVIRFRKIHKEEVIEYYVSGEKMEVVDIPPGYTHNIENLGETDMVTIIWANEVFNPDEPDTYYLEV